MGATILDAILAQAKSALTRSYLAAGLLPALTLVLGWLAYESRGLALRGLATFLDNKSSTDLSAESLLYAMTAVAIGVVFFAARGLVLYALQDMPGMVLEPIRDLLLSTQINRWWAQRRLNAAADKHLTAIRLVRDDQLDAKKGPGDYGAEASRLQRSQSGRTEFLRSLKSVRHVGRSSADVIVDGLLAYFALTGPHRISEAQRWREVTSQPHAQELVARLYADARRRSFQSWQEINRQPLEEWWLAPTRLGNRTAALEDYATRRYKIATSTLFTRLWGTLGQSERTEISVAQLTVETFANLTAAFAMLGVAVASTSLYRSGVLMRDGAAMSVDWWTLAFLTAIALLCYGAYNAAVFAFNTVAENITRLIDLHRVRVLTAFGFAPPETFAEEQALFNELGQFLTSGVDSQIRHRKLDARQKAASPATR